MQLVSTRGEIAENIGRLREYLAEPGVHRDYALERIELGICFVVTESSFGLFFAPSRFVGYQSNTHAAHERNDSKDGRDTNEALEVILGGPPEESPELARLHEEFCAAIGGRAQPTPFARRRKFWDFRGKRL